MSEGKLEKVDKAFDSVKSIIWGVILIAIAIGAVVFFVNKPTENKEEETRMSITEAQKKCTVFSFVGFKKADYEKATIEEASKHCLAMWDSPDREDTFIDYVTKEWEAWKDEEYEGQTVEEIYNDMKDSL